MTGEDSSVKERFNVGAIGSRCGRREGRVDKAQETRDGRDEQSLAVE